MTGYQWNGMGETTNNVMFWGNYIGNTMEFKPQYPWVPYFGGISAHN